MLELLNWEKICWKPNYHCVCLQTKCLSNSNDGFQGFFCRFFIDGAHTLESIGVCRNWFTEKTSTSTKAKVLIFNLTGKRNAPVFFDELAKCDSDVVIFTPNVGSENDRAGNFHQSLIFYVNCTYLVLVLYSFLNLNCILDNFNIVTVQNSVC